VGEFSYSAYLKSEHWLETRRAALERAGYRCQVCNGRKNLQVHHNSYENLGHELDRDLIAMCDRCHTLYSERMPKPPTVIPEGVAFTKWYPAGRQGEIVRALETEQNPVAICALLAEKIAIDRGRT
jgi:5-methylcytosine-specific restriction endonuclease McrA